jgi:hypothetical protein
VLDQGLAKTVSWREASLGDDMHETIPVASWLTGMLPVKSGLAPVDVDLDGDHYHE